MSNAKKCDRCGAFYEKSNPGGGCIEHAENKMCSSTMKADLCPWCYSKLTRWLKDEVDR